METPLKLPSKRKNHVPQNESENYTPVFKKPKPKQLSFEDTMKEFEYMKADFDECSQFNF